ncbi:MAG: hypothetical protein ACJ77K_00940 [Bacteroidia bacterium]
MTDKQIDIIDQVELSSATVSLRDDGIFRVEMKIINRELEEKDVRELTESIGIIGKRAKYPVLVVVNEYNAISKEASEYAASEIAARYTVANAVVVKSAAIRIATNFFIRIFKPVRPTKMFSEEEKAILWLRTLMY